MQELIDLAYVRGQGFTSLIVDTTTGNILCYGSNIFSTDYNPTSHSETVAITNCSDLYMGKMNWKTAALVSTAEPCTMCASAVIWAGLSKIVYGTSQETLIEFGYKAINIYSEEVAHRQTFSKVEIIGGVRQDQTDKMFKNPPTQKQVLNKNLRQLRH